MKDCIFCKVVKGESPSYKVYEDDLFFGFLDIYPRTLGHTLLVPKKHYRWVYGVPEFKKYWKAVLKVTEAMKRSLKPHFVTYVTHGLAVAHAHIHILPREEKETAFVPPNISLSEKKMEETAEKIREAIR